MLFITCHLKLTIIWVKLYKLDSVNHPECSFPAFVLNHQFHLMGHHLTVNCSLYFLLWLPPSIRPMWEVYKSIHLISGTPKIQNLKLGDLEEPWNVRKRKSTSSEKMRRTQYLESQPATTSLKQLKWHKTTRKINDHSPLSHPYTPVTPKTCPLKTRQFPIGHSLEMQYLQYRLNSCSWYFVSELKTTVFWVNTVLHLNIVSSHQNRRCP